MRSLQQWQKLIVCHIKAKVKQPESQIQQRNGSQFLEGQWQDLAIRHQKDFETTFGITLRHPSDFDFKTKVLLEGHDVVYNPTVSKKIKIKKRDGFIALEMEILWEEVEMTVTRSKRRMI